MTTLVRCPTCYREERWTPGAPVEVLLSGGARQPLVHPALASFRILRAALDGRTGPVVGPCAKCGLPAVASSPAAPAFGDWTLQAPEGPLVVGSAAITGPAGAMTAEDAETWLERQVRPRFELAPGRFAFTTLLFLLMLVPFACWLIANLLVYIFLSGVAQGQLGG